MNDELLNGLVTMMPLNTLLDTIAQQPRNDVFDIRQFARTFELNDAWRVILADGTMISFETLVHRLGALTQAELLNQLNVQMRRALNDRNYTELSNDADFADELTIPPANGMRAADVVYYQTFALTNTQMVDLLTANIRKGVL